MDTAWQELMAITDLQEFDAGAAEHLFHCLPHVSSPPWFPPHVELTPPCGHTPALPHSHAHAEQAWPEDAESDSGRSLGSCTSLACEAERRHPLLEAPPPALDIPFSLENIIHLPADEFQQLLSRSTLSLPQVALARDIRRRGKNKAAAQRCRRRKLERVERLEEELERLRAEREGLGRDKLQIQSGLTLLRQQLEHLSARLFSALRDEAGRPYSHQLYSLTHAHDGNLYIVPRAQPPAGPVTRCPAHS